MSSGRTKCKGSGGLAECMVGLQAGTRAKAENLPRVPADKRARVRLARARQQKLAVERRLLLNTGSWVQPNELQAGSTACAFPGPWCQHTACPHQLLHPPCSAAQDQVQEAASRFHRRPGQRQSGWCQEAKLHAHVYVYTCVCVCVPSRVNISATKFHKISLFLAPTYTEPGTKHQVSWLKQGNEDTPESWLLGTEMAVRDAFGHCEKKKNPQGLQ